MMYRLYAQVHTVHLFELSRENEKLSTPEKLVNIKYGTISMFEQTLSNSLCNMKKKLSFL